MVTSTSSRGRGLVYSRNSTLCSSSSSSNSYMGDSSIWGDSDGIPPCWDNVDLHDWGLQDTYEHIKCKNNNCGEELSMEVSTVVDFEITSLMNWSILSESQSMSVFNSPGCWRIFVLVILLLAHGVLFIMWSIL